jgi:hypothetical protein
MEEATLNFLHLCDAANIDSLGKISILGIFGKIFVPDLARTPVKFTIVLSLTIQDLDPDRSMVQIKIFGPDNEELRTQEPIAVDLQTERVILEKRMVSRLSRISCHNLRLPRCPALAG